MRKLTIIGAIVALCVAGLATFSSASSADCYPGYEEYGNFTQIETNFTLSDNEDGNLEKNCWEANVGAQTLYGQEYTDTLLGGNGNDNLYGGDYFDLVRGQVGADEIQGGDGPDVLHGGDGNDVIAGGSGDDYLYDGNGNDTVQGGPGTDTWCYQFNDGYLDSNSGIENSEQAGVGVCQS